MQAEYKNLLGENSQMKQRGISISAFMALAIYIVIGAALLISFPGAGYNSVEKELYGVLMVSYFVVLGLVVLAVAKHNLYLFEPFTIIALLYIGIFIYRPIQDLYAHKVSYAGVNLVQGGVKATILFTLGFVAFYIRYYCKKRAKETPEEIRESDVPDSISWLVIAWAVFFAFCIISSLSQGVSLQYIFSLGQQGERVVNESNTVLLFLSNFATSLLVVWLMIMVISKSVALKIVLSVLTIIYLIMRNARWLVLIMGISPFVYYYTKRRKSPRLIWTLILGFLALVVFAWMQMNRYYIATGKELQSFGEQGGLTLELLMSPFDSDLTTYTTFYGMVQSYPSAYPYMFGRTFLYVFILFVPRVLWAGKPDNPVRDMVEHSLGALARTNGRAVANIGEFYANFGIIGIVVLMFLFGYIVSKLKHMYEEPSENRLIMYAFLYPLMFQWVARGNFSGNFYYTLFGFVPLLIQWFVKHLGGRRA